MKKLEPKHPRAIRWFHWINFPILSLMVWSGLLIYWANPVYRIGIGDFTLFKFFPAWFFNFFHVPQRLAEGMTYHFFLMWFFMINGVLYVSYTFISGEWRELVPQRGTLKHALHTFLHDLHIRKDAPPPQKFNGAQQIAYTSIILMGFGSLVTGLAIYKPTTFWFVTALVGGYEWARFIHFWLTVGYVGFYFIHVGQVIKAGWNNFRAMVTGYEVVESHE